MTIDSTFTISELVSLAQHFKIFASNSLATRPSRRTREYSSDFASLGSVLYVQQPQANQVISQFLGGPAPEAITPPPGPYGTVSTTTTTAPSSTYSNGGSTPSTSAPVDTTTTIPINFDPTPC